VLRYRLTDQVPGQADHGHVFERVRPGRNAVGHADADVEQKQRQANAVANERGGQGQQARELGPPAAVGRAQDDEHALVPVRRRGGLQVFCCG